LFNIVLATLYAVTVPSLAALGERRLDVYVSMFTLEYFICLGILRPRRVVKDFIAVALFISFAVAVAYRVMEVLAT
jgi:hypothetical protein